MRLSVAMQSFGILATACSFDIESSKQGAFHTTSWFTGGIMLRVSCQGPSDYWRVGCAQRRDHDPADGFYVFALSAADMTFHGHLPN